jgi:hypothetical protein
MKSNDLIELRENMRYAKVAVDKRKNRYLSIAG